MVHSYILVINHARGHVTANVLRNVVLVLLNAVILVLALKSYCQVVLNVVRINAVKDVLEGHVAVLEIVLLNYNFINLFIVDIIEGMKALLVKDIISLDYY